MALLLFIAPNTLSSVVGADDHRGLFLAAPQLIGAAIYCFPFYLSNVLEQSE